MTASLKRIGALIVKELHQVVRDPGNVGIAVILPAVLLLLFGYGMSMDIKNVRIAYLAVPASSQSTDLETRLTLSRYFQTTRVFSTREAEEKLRTHEADAFIALQSNAPDTLHNGTTKVQIVVNGVNANQATLIRIYLQAVVGSWASSLGGRTAPVLDVQTRTRFNEANDSHYYLVPGVIVTIMTMIGALLPSLGMAREYERGTLESLFVTPVGSGEILAAKATDGVGTLEVMPAGVMTEPPNPLGGTMSDFSSWGVTPDLKLKPEIEAKARANHGTRTALSATLPESSDAVDTRKELAEAVGLGERTMG